MDTTLQTVAMYIQAVLFCKIKRMIRVCNIGNNVPQVCFILTHPILCR